MNKLTLVSGIGFASDNTACLMSAARIFSGEANLSDPRDDNCSRVCPIVRHIAIRLNDLSGWSSNALRTSELLPLVPMLIDTATSDHEVLRKRAYLCVDYTIRVFAPLIIERCGNDLKAARLRALPPIIDEISALSSNKEMYTHKIDYNSHAINCITSAVNGNYDIAVWEASSFAGLVSAYCTEMKSLLIELLTKLCAIK